MSLVAIADQAQDVLGDVDAGLNYALSAVLQSPYFLFRVESRASPIQQETDVASPTTRWRAA